MSVERGVAAGTERGHRALGDDDVLGARPHQPHARRACSTASPRTSAPAASPPTSGSAIDNNVMLVMGPEHRRFLVDAGWSKADARGYLFPLLKEGERPVRIGKPEGILIVAAGGPGMSETWVLFPHLAWAITEPVVPEIPAGGVIMSVDRSRSHQRPDARVGPGPGTPDAARSRARSSASCRTGSARATRSCRPSHRELVAVSGARDVVFVRKPSVSVPPDPMDWEKLISQVTVAVAGFGG